MQCRCHDAQLQQHNLTCWNSVSSIWACERAHDKLTKWQLLEFVRQRLCM